MADQPIDEKEVFNRVRHIAAPEERLAYVQATCGQDQEAIHRVLELLRVYEQEKSFLESPAAGLPVRGVGAAVLPSPPWDPGPGVRGGPTLDEPIRESPGTVIGPYKLLQQIGEGGMGVVWMAEQTQPVQRKVALKVIKPGMDSRQVIARFEAERQALAMMDHVNIARVFDGGTTGEVGSRQTAVGSQARQPGSLPPAECRLPAGGRPYFVMELVHGVPITKYCDDNHLTPRERLELFVPVCQAIQHAHQKGIIHRDIKPSNVMVTLYDGKPVPKVIDFGVAKATEQKLTERTLFTQYGTMVGTLEYMSPEQAEMSALGVDTRSDIYSLGVLLYELLTGSTPLTRQRMKEAAYAEILRMIKEEEPPRPSTRLSDSGEALASISANRHTEPAKLTKLVRGELDWIVMKTLEKDRNRRYETAKDFAADVQRYLNDDPVQACPPSAWYRFRKFARRNKAALVMASVIGVALLLAVGSLGWVARDREAGRVRTAGEVNQFLQRAESLYADNKLPEAVAEVQKARGVLEAGSGDEDLGRRVRQWVTDLDTAAKLEEIRLEAYGASDHDLDRDYADYARLFREYGIDVEALPVEEAAARIAASQIKLDLALALGIWQSRLRFDPRPQDPAGWQRLLAISRTADPDPWRLRLYGAVEAKDVQTLRELANGTDTVRLRTRTLAYLGDSLTTAGDAEAAVAFLRKVQRQHPGDFSINSNLAYCLTELKSPPWDEAIGFQRAALALRPHSFGAHNNLGVALLYQQKLPEASAAFRKAIEIDPKNAIACNNLGLTLDRQGKLDEAIAWSRKAIELDPKHANAHNILGLSLRHQGRLDEAIAAYRKAIDLDPKHAVAHYNLGTGLMNQGKLDEAIARYRTAIELDPKHVNAHDNLGTVLRNQGKLDEGIANHRKAIELDPKHANAHNNLGNALNQQGKLDEAIASHRKAIELDPKHANAHNNLGCDLCAQKKLDEAIACYRTAIELDPKYARAHNALAWLLATCPEAKFRDPKRAVELANKAVQLEPKDGVYWQTLGYAEYRAGNWKSAIMALEKVKELGSPGDGLEWFPLAMAHWQLGDKEAARQWYHKAVAWMDKNQPQNEELRRIRAEAAELLRVEKKKD